MTAMTLEQKTKPETPDEAKARRNAKYLAKLEKSMQQHAEGKVFVTSIEALEAMTDE
jgi:hypothetical protein